MNRKIIILLLIIIVSAASIFSIGHNNSFEILGTRTVDFRADRDTIVVTAKEGRFRKIMFKVSKNAVEMYKLVITYGNGDTDKIPVKWIFRKGNWSRIIDLEGNKRIIKKITFYYRSIRRSGNKKAVVKIFGLR